MKIKKYEASDMREALKIVKEDLGPDAVILTTRKIMKNNNLFGKPVLEVTAAIDYVEPKRSINTNNVASYNNPSFSSSSSPKRYPPPSRKIDFTINDNPYENQRTTHMSTQTVESSTMVNNNIDMDDVVVDDILRDLSEHSNATIPPINNYYPDRDSQLAYKTYKRDFGGFNDQDNRVERRPIHEVLQEKSASSLTSIDLSTLLQDISDIKKQLVDIKNSNSMPVSVDINNRLKDSYAILCRSGVDDLIAYRFLQSIEKFMSSKLSNIQIKNQVIESLADLIPIKEDYYNLLKNKIFILVGPTGVGKTTTLAKIAAKLRLDYNQSVALITIDNYRIGAVEQLRTYADIVNIPLYAAASPSELKALVRDIRKEYDFILVDSMGRSQFDSKEINNLSEFVKIDKDVSVGLLLSMSSNPQELNDTFERFSVLEPEYLIFTKLDETRYFGSLVNIPMKRKLPLLLITSGQNVPDDMEVPDGKKIAKKILQEVPSLWNDRRAVDL